MSSGRNGPGPPTESQGRVHQQTNGGITGQPLDRVDELCQRRQQSVRRELGTTTFSSRSTFSRDGSRVAAHGQAVARRRSGSPSESNRRHGATQARNNSALFSTDYRTVDAYAHTDKRSKLARAVQLMNCPKNSAPPSDAVHHDTALQLMKWKCARPKNYNPAVTAGLPPLHSTGHSSSCRAKNCGRVSSPDRDLQDKSFFTQCENPRFKKCPFSMGLTYPFKVISSSS